MTQYADFTEQSGQNRGKLLRMGLFYGFWAVLSLALVILATYQIASGQTGFLVMLILFGIVSVLTGSQALQYLRDLGTDTMEIQGEVVRKWHKGNFLIFLMPSYYLLVDSKVLRGRVSRVDDEGAYVVMESGQEGLVPRRELVGEKGQTPQDMVSPGQDIFYKVTNGDGRGNYRLSCRKAEERALVGKIFTVTREEYAMLLEQDLVKVSCYPHSATVDRVDRYDDIEKKFIPATSGATF
jgi:predicted RNA-binding protein with RPS1 domain